jgi:hypothetical protein
MINSNTFGITQTARSTPFDNSTNGYDAQNEQEAHEEIDYRRVTFEPTGFVNRTDSVISFVNGTRTFTIAPTTISYDYYVLGHKKTKYAPESITWTDTPGAWFFYFVDTVLTASQTPWTFGTNNVFIAEGYWDADHNEMILFAEERHGLTMDWATHQRFHRSINGGAMIEKDNFLPGNYILTGNGSSNTHCQFSITNGFLNDEDIRLAITNSATPTLPFEQKLSTIAWLPVYYKEGAGGFTHKNTATAFPVYSNSPNTIYFNNYNTGTSQWELKNVTNNWYTVMWVAITNSISEPVIAIMGQYEAPSIILADNYNRLETLDLTQFPSAEYYFRWKIIVQTSTSYTNTPKAVFRRISDASITIINNDRYAVDFSYNGNAGSGKYLEHYSGQTSDTSPFIVPEDSYVRTITLRTTANSTGTVNYYAFPNLTTPFFTMSFTNQTYKKEQLTILIPADQGIAVKVQTGSFNKPHGSVMVQSGGA